MQFRTALSLLFLALPLAACATSGDHALPPIAEPPVIAPIPSDVRACIREPADTGTEPLNEGEAERLWSTDRAALVRVNGCLRRLICLYQDVRKDIGHINDVGCEKEKNTARPPKWLSLLRGSKVK
jgi:hypothetical protein